MTTRQAHYRTRKKILSTVFRSLALAATGVMVATAGLAPTSADATTSSRDDRQYVRKCIPADPKTTSGEYIAPDGAPGSAVGGSWSTPGTDSYVQAQHLFSTLTETYGTSGAFAAGVIGNVAQESGFVPDRAQGPGMLRFGMNSKVAPVGIQGGGGGLFQFTPFTKFTNSSYWGKLHPDGWDAANQIAFVFETSFMNEEVMRYVLSTNPRYGAALYGRAPAFNTMDEMLSTSDPRRAAEAFQVGYERPAKFHPERLEMAAIANTVFNSSNVPANPAKWGLTDGRLPSEVNDVSDVDASLNQTQWGEECETEEGETGVWADFVGTHGLDVPDGLGKFYKYGDLPSQLKPYNIDIESLGIGFNDCSNWTQFTNTTSPLLNGQCVALVKAAFHSIWKSNNGSANPAFSGNGAPLAGNAAAAFGGSISTAPSKGAIASVDSGATMCGGSPCGHTYIVAHVFSNGDILLIEQNIAGYSGWATGASCNWNYRLQTKSGYESMGTRFYTPKDDGYSPDPTLTHGVISAAAGGSGGSGASPSEAIKLARTQTGAPYSLGAQGPKAYDCSGIIWWAYGKLGVALPRSADAQYKKVRSDGNLKPLGALEPGDLVFWDYGGDGRIDHVAFFLGGGRILHASKPGTPLGEGSLYSLDRIVGGGKIA